MPAILIYEVECQLDPDVVVDYDAWLPGHIRDVLACAGFLGATIEAPQTAPGESKKRLIRYRVESAAALDHYLENNATRLRTETAQRFGARVHCARRVLQPRHDLLSAELEPRTCLDCGAAVTSRHCVECGQSGDVHVLSMKEVAGDVTHSILHLDSRVWRTLRLLVLRPGELTREFIAGRHQRYLPPFRLYFAISILFFALSALLPGFSLVQVHRSGEEVVAPVVIESRDKAIEQAAAGAEPCTVDLPPIFGVDWNDPLRRACLKIRADGGVALAERFAATAPKLMFLFLPLMAGFALLFYWRPRRLYAEHLVLFLHNHAFTYLLILVTQVVSAIALLKMPFIGVLGFVNFLLFLYLLYYIYRSMRVVYGEHRVKTAFKYLALVSIYFLLLGITMMAGLVYSVLSLS
ncbi:MAG: DUF4286 family protein [Steroidobacteraceae bacterium]